MFEKVKQAIHVERTANGVNHPSKHISFGGFFF